jgi:large subunit ribosomal protein L23
MALKLTAFDIIQGPVLTDKSYKLYKTANTLVLRVHPQANKPQIAQVVEQLFNVKVKDVRTMVRKGKKKSVRGTRLVTTDPKQKKAYVTLAAGYSVDLFGQGSASASGVEGQVAAETAVENKG